MTSSFKIDPETLDFELPDDRIAQTPAPVRDEAKLMVLDRKTRNIRHSIFRDLPGYLNSGDVLVLNQAKVNAAKFRGKKETGGRVEIIFVEEQAPSSKWVALLRPSVRPGVMIELAEGQKLKVETRRDLGDYEVTCLGFDPRELMVTQGQIPLPPYIKRSPETPSPVNDKEEYQTVYAQTPGSVAAPTAGLHFTSDLLAKCQMKGVKVVQMVLHVGWGTFKPILGSVNSHQMMGERYEFSVAALTEIFNAKKDGRRIIAVGTTATRSLESLPDELPDGPLSGETTLFIKPGFNYRFVSNLITNFHVPRSTPISLTAAFAGFDFLEEAYGEALEKKYRFYSYGDAMLIQ